MKLIGTKINNAPFTTPGRRFAEEDNSIFTELSNVISPFEALAEVKEKQMVASIKALSWMSGYAVVTGTTDSLIIESGLDINNQDVPLKHGMRFAFKSIGSNTTSSVTAIVNNYQSKPVLLDGLPVPIGYILGDSEYILQYNSVGDNYDIVVSGCMRYITNGPRYALWQGEQDVIFRVDDPINPYDAVNLQTLEAMLSNLAAAPGSVEYDVPGNYTFTVPQGVHTITAFAIGGGGGGTSLDTSTSNSSWVEHSYIKHTWDWEYRYKGDVNTNTCANIITDEAQLSVYFTTGGAFHAGIITSGTRASLDTYTSAVINGITVRKGAYSGTGGYVDCNQDTVPRVRDHWNIQTYETTSSTQHLWYGGGAGVIMGNIQLAVTPGDVISLTVGSGGSHNQNGTATKVNGVSYAGGLKGAQTSSATHQNTTPLGNFTRYAAIGSGKGGEHGLGNGGRANGTILNATGYGSGGGGFNPSNISNQSVLDAAKGRNGYINISWS